MHVHKPAKYIDKALSCAASAVWVVFEMLNRIKPNPSFKPKWSDKPLLKSWEKTKPQLGWPRTTDSLCPKCVPEIRQEILDGKKPLSALTDERPDDIKTLLDNAISIKPRRQMSVQFSGGEPTLSPYFLDAIRYARKLGYNSVQAATNGIEFAQSPEFCRQAFEAGLRLVYLQFDGIG